MASPLFTNNAASGLVYPISNVDVTLYLNGGSGALFPQPTGGNYFMVTLISQLTGNTEIVKCIARSGDILTVIRAQEGTTAQAFATGDSVQLRITAGSLNLFNNPTSANSLVTTNYTVEEEAGKLVIKYQGTTIASFDNSGNLTTAGSVISAGTP
jgi:hypothetical protein